MKLKNLKEIKNLKGKRVLLRVDFNVPIKNNCVQDNTRIKAALPTINYLLGKKAIIIIVAHLGRPNGKIVDSLRLDPVADELSILLKKKVKKFDNIKGPELDFIISQSAPGKIYMLENIRFYPAEEKNSMQLAKQLAQFADFYVNNAFSASHRKHASILAITKYLPSYAGLNLENEIKVLNKFLKNPKRPMAVIIGGVKISTKLEVIKKFLEISDNVLIGGALANTVLRAKGIAVGKSIIESKMIKKLKNIDLTNTKLHIPVDTVTSIKISEKTKSNIKAAGNINNNELILDIGPDTVKLFTDIIKDSKTIIWNGPMGAFECPQFSKSTKGILNAILNTKADIIIGGGDTIAALNKFSPNYKKNKNIYVSTGGGAMLNFIEDGTLVGIEPLKK